MQFKSVYNKLIPNKNNPKKKYMSNLICFSKPKSSIVSLIDSDEENFKVKKNTYCDEKGK